MTNTNNYDKNAHLHGEPLHEYAKVDYITDSLEYIAQYEIIRLRGYLADIKESNRLCSSHGRFIVAEFGFTGNIDAVLYKLEEHIRNIEQNGITDLHRIHMQNRFMMAATIVSSENEVNPYIIPFKKAANGLSDPSKMLKYFDDMKNYENEKHENKTCLCYNNEE